MSANFSKKLSLGWELTKIAYFYIARDLELFWYSLLSIIIIFLVFWFILTWVYFSWISYEEIFNNMSENTFLTILCLVSAGFYLISAFIAYFFRAAIITSIERRLAGEDNSFIDGIRSAWQRIGKIFIWSLLESTVFLLIDLIDKVLLKRSFLKWILHFTFINTWKLMTYFAFPLIVLTKWGLKDSMKNSAELFKKHFWENVGSYVGGGMIISIIIIIVFLVAFLFMFLLF